MRLQLWKPGSRFTQVQMNFSLRTEATVASENVTVLVTLPAAQQPSLSKSPTRWKTRRSLRVSRALATAASIGNVHFTPSRLYWGQGRGTLLSQHFRLFQLSPGLAATRSAAARTASR